MLLGIHHTALSTPDLERLVAFYRAAFGFERALDFAWDESNPGFRRTHAAAETKGRVVMLERGASRLEIFQYEKPAPRPAAGPRRHADHGICHLCFEVKDAEFRKFRSLTASLCLAQTLVIGYAFQLTARDPGTGPA